MIYTEGTVDVTNGSAIVTGVGTKFITEVKAGDIFIRSGDVAIYTVAVNPVSDTSLILTGNYAGVTGTGLAYGIIRDFTFPDNIPFPNRGDVETATILKEAILRIQLVLEGLKQKTFPVPLVQAPEVGLIFYDGFEPSEDITLVALSIFAGTAPTGAALTIDVLKDGVAETNEATLADGSQHQKTTLGTPIDFTSAQRMGFKVTAVGATEPGNDIYLTIHYKKK